MNRQGISGPQGSHREWQDFMAKTMESAPKAAIAAYRGAMSDQTARPGAARGSRYEASKPARFVGSDGRILKRPAVQGFAAIYQTTFQAKGHYVFLQAGCLDDSIYQPGKLLLLDHSEQKQVGATSLGLEFANTSAANPVHGLAYRMPLDAANADSEMIFNTVSKLERPCVSIGISYDKAETIQVEGQDVEVVIKASLKEISLVREGAVPGTNASLVDLDDEEPWLWMAARSRRFVADKLIGNVEARAKRITDALRGLKL
ncbi:MAG: hypothetical protein JWR21_4447 [Herminiimonas sp.]|nr:hypothetical protein [Herminiimonas sp.]